MFIRKCKQIFKMYCPEVKTESHASTDLHRGGGLHLQRQVRVHSQTAEPDTADSPDRLDITL